MVITLVLLPALLPGLARGAAAEAGADPGATSGDRELAAAAVAAGTWVPGSGDVLDSLPAQVPPPPTTTVPPTTTTTAPRPRPTTTTTAAPRPKPTTTTVPTPTVTVPPIVGTTQSGRATWYEQSPGVCAHRSLPFGTVVTVTATATGAQVACTVGDRGPFVVSSIIDLAPEDFAQLADPSAGVVAVVLTW